MADTDKNIVRVLNGLHRYCIAGEKGFEVVAENARNRGLKMLLKSYAQQRAVFADELETEIKRYGGEVSKRDSIRGLVHRGRIDIVATMTIGDHNVENSILGETLLGEAAAVNYFGRALRRDLPSETQTIVKRQHDEIQKAHDHIELLRGRSGKRLVVRLFDSQADTRAAIDALVEAGFSEEDMKTIPVGEFSSTYEGQGTTMKETVISGALGGAIWGSVFGAVTGLTIPVIPGMEPFIGSSFQSTWAVFALGGTVVGALFAALLGFLIGLGISEEDVYLYDNSLRYGVELLELQTDSDRWLEATQIMHQINAAARARALTNAQSAY
jgi:uncharacterized protein (TIGR02284 family)